MVCHMHQPNIFLNSYLGYTMWDYESDADLMWPGPENRLPARNAAEEQRFRNQRYPNQQEVHDVLEPQPGGGGGARPVGRSRIPARGLRPGEPARPPHPVRRLSRPWLELPRHLPPRPRGQSASTPTASVIPPGDPDTFRREGEGLFVPVGVNPGRSVHMMDIHAERGLQCADCHFAQDAHGNGFIYGEVANAIEIGCRDCHGTLARIRQPAHLRPAAPPNGTNLELIRNEDGRRRFEWIERDGRRVLIQRSIVDPNLEWEVSQVRDSTDRQPAALRGARRPGDAGPLLQHPLGPRQADVAHRRRDRPLRRSAPACRRASSPIPTTRWPASPATCRWTTSCAGCHLPIEANNRTTIHHYEGEETRNFATYNPQVARDEMFQLGRHQTTKDNIIAPIRSTSALVLSSTNVNRERIYVQQPPISASGFSSQAFAPHFPHTVRRTETKQCTDCHVSQANDNNAIMAQLLLHGTNFVNFVGMHAWTGMQERLPGDPRHRMGRAAGGDRLLPPPLRLSGLLPAARRPEPARADQLDARPRPSTRISPARPGTLEEFANVVQGTPGAVRCLQMRGEYMFVAAGPRRLHGLRHRLDRQ